MALPEKNTQELIDESMDGLTRVKGIVSALRDFSHAGTSVWERADLHAAIDNALKIVANTMCDNAEIIKHYNILTPVSCMPS